MPSNIAYIQSEDIRRLIAALRYTNQQLAALMIAVENPEFYDMDKAMDNAHTTFERVNTYQLNILAKYQLIPSQLPAYLWDVP